MVRRLTLAAWLLIAGYGIAGAGPIEVQTPEGRTAVLYDDFTWEYKQPAPSLTSTTLEAAPLVDNPGKFQDQEVVVVGSLARLLGAYRLQSDSAQKSLPVNVEGMPEADRIKLKEALEAAGMIGSVKVQIRGSVERKFMIYRLVASDLVLIEE